MFTKTLKSHNRFLLKSICPVDKGRKLNAHKTFRRRPGRLLNVLCAFNLRPVPRGSREEDSSEEDSMKLPV